MSGNESMGAFHLEDISQHPAPCTESADYVLADAQAESCCSGAFSLGNSWAMLTTPVGTELQAGAPPCSFAGHSASPGAALGHPGGRSPAALLAPALAPSGLRFWETERRLPRSDGFLIPTFPWSAQLEAGKQWEHEGWDEDGLFPLLRS